MKGNAATDSIAGNARAKPGFFSMLREEMRCVFERGPSARNTPEVLKIYPGIHSLVLHRIAHILWNRGMNYAGRMLSRRARVLTAIDIHPGANFGPRLFIAHGCGVVIGGTAEVGDGVRLCHGVTLGGTTLNAGKRHPALGSGVVVSAGAKIPGPITVGANACIAASPLVIEDVDPGLTGVGTPGRLVPPKTRPRIAQDIDLDHYQMPAAAGKAIACLPERIAEMKPEVARQAGQPAPSGSACPNATAPAPNPHSPFLATAPSSPTQPTRSAP